MVERCSAGAAEEVDAFFLRNAERTASKKL